MTDFDSYEHQARLKELYADFEAAGMTPLWLTREGLMPFHPQPRAVPHLWRWAELLPLAARSAELVPVGRGGERRAISLGNPGLTGDPYTTPTLWAAIQYLAPREDAPEHRHTQSAFRFVLEGEGVWTVVDGDPVAMRRGDLLLTPGWAFHGHQNVSDTPMAWLDGLDIPLVAETDQGFCEFGPDQLRNRKTPDRSATTTRSTAGGSWIRLIRQTRRSAGCSRGAVYSRGATRPPAPGHRLRVRPSTRPAHTG